MGEDRARCPRRRSGCGRKAVSGERGRGGIDVNVAIFDGGVDAGPLALEDGREAEGGEEGYGLAVEDEGIEGFGQGITAECKIMEVIKGLTKGLKFGKVLLGEIDSDYTQFYPGVVCFASGHPKFL